MFERVKNLLHDSDCCCLRAKKENIPGRLSHMINIISSLAISAAACRIPFISSIIIDFYKWLKVIRVTGTVYYFKAGPPINAHYLIYNLLPGH